MGLLINGTWQTTPRGSDAEASLLAKDAPKLRNWVTPDGRSFTSEVGFAAEPNRYHLYISKACPFAHRTIIVHGLKALDGIVTVSEVGPTIRDKGWEFTDAYPDPVNNREYLHEVYTKSHAELSSRVTVPVLWDRKLNTIVSTDSGDIMRMFNSAFNQLTGNTLDLYPMGLRHEIDDLNAWLYSNINVGVYRAGFAKTTGSYRQASTTVFAALDLLEERLSHSRYLLGDQPTESDWRLFTTLVRFDAVYHSLFKLNQALLADYKNLSGYVRDLYQLETIGDTVDVTQIKQHYFTSFTSLNPSGLIPTGGQTDFSKPPYRALPEGMEKHAC
ncbi:MAG: glutathione S-transferase family protein [Pseudomonadales bacterium]|nr:glutathione S-transferase family protein [Pseudomonadales bacterium]